MKELPEGLLLVDKPRGPTSHDIVERVRRALRQKVGHTGTLDPPATGLLPLVLGRATRMVRFLPHSPKIYEGTFVFGITTDTDDTAGRILERSGTRLPSPDEIRRSSARLEGKLLQVPPAVSAKKVDGRRLYQSAREGRPVEVEPFPVEVFRLELQPTERPEVWAFTAEVTAGTYVRSLARDLGALLGCGGALGDLRRTAIGPLKVADAASLVGAEEDLAPILRRATIPLEAMPFVPPKVRFEDGRSRDRFLAGLPAPTSQALPCGTCMVCDADGAILGVGQIEDGLVQPKVVLRPGSAGVPCEVPSRT